MVTEINKTVFFMPDHAKPSTRSTLFPFAREEAAVVTILQNIN